VTSVKKLPSMAETLESTGMPETAGFRGMGNVTQKNGVRAGSGFAGELCPEARMIFDV